MTIRTEAEFVQKVDDQLVWRRKELTQMLGFITRDTSPARAMLIRAGVALLYAHWEGFIKITGTYLLQYISAQRLNPSQLKSNFICIMLRPKLASAFESKKVAVTAELVEFFTTKMNSRVNLPTKNVIDTQSNLSSVVFQEILSILGLDKSPYDTYFFKIDNRLVGARNSIAHGEALNVTLDDYTSLHDDVLYLLNAFRDQIQNCCALKSFMHPPSVVSITSTVTGTS